MLLLCSNTVLFGLAIERLILEEPSISVQKLEKLSGWPHLTRKSLLFIDFWGALKWQKSELMC